MSTSVVCALPNRTELRAHGVSEYRPLAEQREAINR